MNSMEEKFSKKGRLSSDRVGGFFLVSEDGRKYSVDKEVASIWSMFQNKTIVEMADIMKNGLSLDDSKKSIAAVAGDLERAGFLTKS